MVERSTLLSLNYYKKAVFSGGDFKMLYRVELEKGAEEGEPERLKATVWRGPYGYEASKKEEMWSERFPFSEEGILGVAAWINEQESAKKDYWDDAPGLLG